MNIHNNTNYPYLFKNKQQSQVQFRGSKNFIQIGNTCLNKIGAEINPNSLNKLSPETKTILNKVTTKRIKELAQVNCFAADKIKTHFDNLYGKDNYTLIAIGRSVASIAETMKYLGSDVKIIPLSGLRKGLPDKISDIKVYKKFLNQNGINRTTIEKNQNRKYILFDYEYTGETLQSADTFFRRDILKSNPKNLITASANTALGDDFHNNFHLLFSLNRFKEFSKVGKLDISNLKNTFTQSKPSTAIEYKSNMAKYLRKIFLFNIFESLKNGKYSNSCEEELKALDRHYLSQKAMKARMEQMTKRMKETLG